MSAPANKTKIVATIGPSCSKPEIVSAMLAAGMNVARLNFSHGDFDSHAATIGMLRAVSEKDGRRLALMADLPGPKIRIGRLEAPIELAIGDQVTLTTEDLVGNSARFSVNFAGLPKSVQPGDKLFLNDGLISIKVLQIRGSEVDCEVRAGGELSSHKGLDLPGIDLGISAFTEHDRQCLEFALEHGVDAVSQSFVSCAADIEAVRAAADELGFSPFIIAKIERKKALDELKAILKVADGIMVARGDLGVEMPIAQMATVQKEIMRKANKHGCPVITATQMLESMTEHRRPTRAEATDVANAILDGTDAVMLSAESAVGDHPVEAVSMLAEIAAATEPHRRPVALESDSPPVDSPTAMIAWSVQKAVDSLNPSAVVVPTHSGATARTVTRYRLPVWITALSTEAATCQALQFSYGIEPVQVPEDLADWTPYLRERVREQGMLDGLAVLTQGPSPANPCGNNRLEIVNLALQ